MSLQPNVIAPWYLTHTHTISLYIYHVFRGHAMSQTRTSLTLEEGIHISIYIHYPCCFHGHIFTNGFHAMQHSFTKLSFCPRPPAICHPHKRNLEGLANNCACYTTYWCKEADAYICCWSSMQLNMARLSCFLYRADLTLLENVRLKHLLLCDWIVCLKYRHHSMYNCRPMHTWHIISCENG